MKLNQIIKDDCIAIWVLFWHRLILYHSYQYTKCFIQVWNSCLLRHARNQRPVHLLQCFSLHLAEVLWSGSLEGYDTANTGIETKQEIVPFRNYCLRCNNIIGWFTNVWHLMGCCHIVKHYLMLHNELFYEVSTYFMSFIYPSVSLKLVCLY